MTHYFFLRRKVELVKLGELQLIHSCLVSSEALKEGAFLLLDPFVQLVAGAITGERRCPIPLSVRLEFPHSLIKLSGCPFKAYGVELGLAQNPGIAIPMGSPAP